MEENKKECVKVLFKNLLGQEAQLELRIGFLKKKKQTITDKEERGKAGMQIDGLKKQLSDNSEYIEYIKETCEL